MSQPQTPRPRDPSIASFHSRSNILEIYVLHVPLVVRLSADPVLVGLHCATDRPPVLHLRDDDQSSAIRGADLVCYSENNCPHRLACQTPYEKEGRMGSFLLVWGLARETSSQKLVSSLLLKNCRGAPVIENMSASDIEEILKRIGGYKGVIGTIIVNSEGIPIRTTLDNSTTVQYASLLHLLTAKARHTVRDIDPQNDLTFLRVRSKKHEIMVAPDKEYFLVVIQNPNDS